MTIDTATPVAVYPIAGAGPYPFNWPFLPGTVVATLIAGPTSRALAPGEFTVTPEAGSLTTGSLSLEPAFAAAQTGALLRICRATPQEQGWAGRANTRELGIEAQLNQMVQVDQDLRADFSRSLRVPGAPIGELHPKPGELLAWDATATNIDTLTKEEFTAALGVTLGAMASRVHQTVNDLVNDTSVTLGQTCATLGYWEKGDLGAGLYEIVTVAELGAAPNGFSNRLMVNGLVARLVQSPDFFVAEQFGVRKNFECSAAWQAAFWAAADAAGTINGDHLRVTFVCSTNIMTKDQLQLSRRDGSTVTNVSFYNHGDITATTGGNLAASTWANPVWMINGLAAFGVGEFGMLDCNRICSGMLYRSGSGMKLRRGTCYRFDRFGVALMDRRIGVAGGAGGVPEMNNWDIKQWLQNDPEFAVDAAFTGDALVLGHKDTRIGNVNLGWSRVALLLLNTTPEVDTGPGTPDAWIDGRNVYAGHKSEGCGDCFLTDIHLMQGRPGGPPRIDQMEIGGPVNIECWSNTNICSVTVADFDSGTYQIHGGGLRIFLGTQVVGGRNRFSQDRAIVLAPEVRVYADGTNQPAPFELHSVVGLNIGFFPFEGNVWLNDYTIINSKGRQNTPGYTGTVQYRGFWNAVSGAPFPSGAAQGDFWVVKGLGTDDVPVVVRGQGFVEGDYLTAIVPAASTTTYAGNWIRTGTNDIDLTNYGVQLEVGAGKHMIKTKPDTSVVPIDEVSYPSGVLHKTKTNVGIHSQTELFEDTEGRYTMDATGPLQFKGWEFINGGTLRPTNDVLKNIGDTTHRLDKLFANKVLLGSGANPWISGGNGTPEGAQSGPIGSLWVRWDGGVGARLYFKATGSGTAGWVALA